MECVRDPIRRLVLGVALTIAAAALFPGPASAELVPNPNTVGFPQQAVGTTSLPQTVLIKNTNPVDEVITVVDLPHGSDFQIIVDDCSGATLAAGADCPIGVVFSPSSSGAKTAELDVSPFHGLGFTVPLSGTGVTKHLTAPPSVEFGVATTEEKTTQQVALKNEGEVGLAISDIKIEGADGGDFSLEGPGCSVQLEPGQGCAVTVGFKPGATGAREAQLKVVSDAVPGETFIQLSGEGAAPELAFEPASYDFGLLEAHAGGARTNLTVRNTGVGAVQLNSAQIIGTGSNEFWIPGNSCAGMTLAPTQTCSVEVQFNANEEGSFAATVQLQSATGSFEAPLTGRSERAFVTPSPAPLTFGPISVGAGQVRELTLNNTGHLPAGFFIAIVSGGDIASFQMLEENCTGHLLAPGEVCTARIRFAPTSAGAKQATVSFFGNGEGGLQIPVEGTAVAPQVTLTPSTYSFGPVAIGSAGPIQTFELRNESAGPYAVDAAVLSGTDLGEFSIRADECTEAVLAPGESCAVAVRFEPESTGAKTATLRLRGEGGTLVAHLSGEGRPGASGQSTQPNPGVATSAAARQSTNGRIVLSFNAHPRMGGGRVVIGRARCVSERACLITVGGHLGAGVSLAPAKVRIAAGGSAPLSLQLPTELRSAADPARVTVTLHWKTGRRHGQVSRGLTLTL